MDSALIIIFDTSSQSEIESIKGFLTTIPNNTKPNLLVWNGLETMDRTSKKQLMSLFGNDIYGLTEDKEAFFEVERTINPKTIHFCDSPELFVDQYLLSRIYDSRKQKITESFFRNDFDISLKKNIPSKFFVNDESSLKKILPIAIDFHFLESDTGIHEKEPINYDGRFGMVITFFKTNYNSYESLKKTIRGLNLGGWYVVLATHSSVPQDIQEMCDLVIFESENIADQRKYSHGVAESSLIKRSLVALRNQGIEWTFKICYDTQIMDYKKFYDWVKDFNYQFVSCKWGDKIVSTNSFFCNIDFALKNFTFFDSIEEFFKRSFFLEDIWEQDIISKNLLDKTYAYPSKDEMFGKNRMDVNFFNYDEVSFRYEENEKTFYVDNRGDKVLSGKIIIIDYYTNLSIYSGQMTIGNGSIWIAPNPIFYHNDVPKNGYVFEFQSEEGEILVRRNLGITDFRNRHILHKVFGSVRSGMSKFCDDTKFPEYVSFKNLNLYEKFGLNSRGIKTFIDAGAHAGMFSLAMMEAGSQKGYLLEPEPRMFDVLKDGLETDYLKVYRKALYKETGTVTLNIFSEHQTTNSIDPTWQANIKDRIEVESTTVDDFFRDHVEEDSIDLFKIDIEGGEYDAFEGMSDETMKKCKCFLIEYHANKNKRVLQIVQKLVRNGYSIMFDKWSPSDGEDYLENDMGILFAFK